MARRPPEVRLREHRDTLCKGGCGLQSAAQPLRGLSQENPKPCLKPPRATKRQVFPRAGGFRRALPSPCQTSGGADTRDPERRAAPAPIPGPRWALCRCRRTYRGPQKTRHPRQPCQSPLRSGQRSGRGTRSAGCPGVPTARARNAGPRESSRPKGTTPLPPNSGDERHSPMRSP